MYSTSILTVLMMYSMSVFQMTEPSTGLADLGLKIQQGEKLINVVASPQTIILSKEKFTVLFDLKKDDDVAQKYYAVRMVADIDPDIFKQFEINKSFEEIPALTSGTSMAGPKDAQYQCIFFDDQAHHYIFYNNEDEKRAQLISKEENGKLHLSFDIENYCMHDLEVNIRNSNFEHIYLVFFVDENLNEKVDEGEFVELEIDFL